jgi:hypothetical protein
MMARSLLKMRPKDIFVQTQHQASALDADGSVVIATSHLFFLPCTIEALILINRHIISPIFLCCLKLHFLCLLYWHYHAVLTQIVSKLHMGYLFEYI